MHLTFQKHYLTHYVIPIAIRSGDYYMFDDLDDEQIELEEPLDKSDEDEEREEFEHRRTGSHKYTVGEVSALFYCLFML